MISTMLKRRSRVALLKALYILVITLNMGIALSLVRYSLPGALETTTLRELAHQRERSPGSLGVGDVVYVALYEYYQADRLVITEEAMAYVGPERFDVLRFGRFATIDVEADSRDFEGFDMAGDVLAEIEFGPELEKKALLLKGEEGEAAEVIVGLMGEDRVVFGPEALLTR